MTRLRVHINLLKWESAKAFGDSPETFINRMNYQINCERIEMNRYATEANTEKDPHRKEWLEGGIGYSERKIKRYEREIRKAQKEMEA